MISARSASIKSRRSHGILGDCDVRLLQITVNLAGVAFCPGSYLDS